MAVFQCQVSGRRHPISYSSTADRDVLVGVIATGGLEIYELGWRAQSARIVAVSTEHVHRIIRRPNGTIFRIMAQGGADPELLAAIAHRYEVSLVTMSELSAIVNIASTKEE
jgi:hypothetical protein